MLNPSGTGTYNFEPRIELRARLHMCGRSGPYRKSQRVQAGGELMGCMCGVPQVSSGDAI